MTFYAAFFNSSVNVPLALSARFLDMCRKRTSYVATMNTLATALYPGKDINGPDFWEFAVHTASTLHVELQASAHMVPEDADLQWQLFQRQYEVSCLERALGPVSTPDGTTAGQLLVDATRDAQGRVGRASLIRPVGPPPANAAAATAGAETTDAALVFTTAAELAAQTGNMRSVLRSKLTGVHAEIAKLQSLLREKGIHPLPPDASLEEARKSALRWLVIRLLELGDSTRKRYGKYRFDKQCEIKETALAAGEHKQLNANVSLFNQILSDTAGAAYTNKLTPREVLNSDTWLVDRADFLRHADPHDGAGHSSRRLYNFNDQLAFMNAVFGIQRSNEELVALQREMISFAGYIGRHVKQRVDKVTCTLRRLVEGHVRALCCRAVSFGGFT